MLPAGSSAQTDAPAATTHHEVFVLHSFGRDFGAFAEVASSFRTELARLSPRRVEYFEASLETARFAGPANEGPLVEYLVALFEERPMDLFVAVGAPAVTFSLRHQERLPPSTPLLATGFTRRMLAGFTPGPTFTAVPAVLDLPAAVEHILQLLPDTEEIVVVLGGSPLSQVWLEETRRDFAPFADRVDFTWTNEWPFEETRARLAALPPRRAILFGELSVDAAGVPYPAHTALDSLHEAANAPMFGLLGAQFGRGIVGGALVWETEAGRQAAATALQILDGAPPENIDTDEITASAPVYDDRELRRWGIPESALQPGSTVMFREPSIWARYRAPVALGLVVIALQAALIGGLLLQHRRRRAAEEEARAFGHRLLTAHEDERRRLARELHDDLTQRLARLSIDAAGVEKALDGTPDREAARTVRHGLMRMSEDVHALSYQLHPSVLDDLGLEQALRVECERFTRRESIVARVAEFDAPAGLPADVAVCLFRIAQEALRNVSLHASADSVDVTIAAANGTVRMTVADDGVGFDPTRRSRRSGLGHTSMRERAALLYGSFDVHSVLGRGTTINVSVPFREQPS